MCLLALIAEEPSYGYEMVAKLEERNLPLPSEGSIYPLLSRLQRQALVEGYLVEGPGGGPPRKYYRISEAGRARLEEWSDEWRSLAMGVHQVLNGGSSG